MINGSFIEISKARNEENPGSTGVGAKIRLWEPKPSLLRVRIHFGRLEDRQNSRGSFFFCSYYFFFELIFSQTSPFRTKSSLNTTLFR